jgi:hypothetical protein
VARPLSELLASIEAVVTGDAARVAARAAAEPEARHLAARLPLVHRTASRSGDWRDILRLQRIQASTTITPEEVACGFQRAAYFFLGSAAFDRGSVAFMMAPSAAGAAATFTPFDTGGVSRAYIQPTPTPASWTQSDRAAFLADHCGDAADLTPFAETFLAAHFHEARQYVSRPQISVPDFTAYHRLASVIGDRRAWTVEVQAHADVSLASPGALQRIVLDRKALWRDVPAPLWGRTVVAPAPPGEAGDLPATVSRLILGTAGGPT